MRSWEELVAPKKNPTCCQTRGACQDCDLRKNLDKNVLAAAMILSDSLSLSRNQSKTHQNPKTPPPPLSPPLAQQISWESSTPNSCKETPMRFFSLPLSLSLSLGRFRNNPADAHPFVEEKTFSAFQKYCTLVTIYRQAAQNGLNSLGFGSGFRVLCHHWRVEET